MHTYRYCAFQKKQVQENGVPYYKFCFEEGCYILIIQMPQLLATTCQKQEAKKDCSFHEMIL